MKAIKCELCGSNDIVKNDGFFVCQYCGTKYSLEEAKKMMIEGVVEVSGTVRIDDTKQIENYRKLASRAFKDKIYEEAYDYYDKILQLNPDDWEAVYKKGISSSWQYSLADSKIDEAIKASKNAFDIIINILKITEESFMEQTKIAMASDMNVLAVSFGNMAMEHYKKNWESNTAAPLLWRNLRDCIDAEEYAMGLLSNKMVESNQTARALYMNILKNLVIHYCEICMQRKYRARCDEYGVSYANVCYNDDYRRMAIGKYNNIVAEIRKYESNYIATPIQNVKKHSSFKGLWK